MNIRNAFLTAADSIESDRTRFNFFNIFTPSVGQPACIIGLVAFYMGEPAGQRCGSSHRDSPLCQKLIGCSFTQFSERMTALNVRSLHCWNESAGAPRAIRLYADKYHPAEPCALIPTSVARIFTMTHGELAKELETA